MDWLQIDREEYDRLLDYNPRLLQSKIIDYIIWMKDEKTNHHQASRFELRHFIISMIWLNMRV